MSSFRPVPSFPAHRGIEGSAFFAHRTVFQAFQPCTMRDEWSRLMQLDIDIEDPWPAGDWEALAERVAQCAISVAPELGNERLAASLLFTSDSQVHELNREWRQRDKPTNVLSFPMLEREDLLELQADGPPELLGDIALACQTCAREAAEKGVSLQDHAAHLVLHGLLHLAGYDHEISAADADAMEAMETKALAQMGIGNPYEEPQTE
ncbi:putative rRNA maturation factor [Altererythrobacter atlanticus]|nr:putative rRNA maturation factor [Croceibacterium atlanticum]